MIRFENSEGVMKHGAVFYAKNNAGEIWVYKRMVGSPNQHL